MKTIALFLGCALLSLSFMGCEKDSYGIIPSNQVSTRNFALADFSELDISDPFQVYIRFSDTEQELRIEANENLHPFIEVEQVNGRLAIQLKRNTDLTDGTAVLKVFITTGAIQAIRAQGNAQVHLQNHWYEDQVEVVLTGASSFKGALTAKRLTAEITGASTLAITGSAPIFDIEATGSSEMTGFDFETDKLTADLTGASQVALTVREELNVTATGSSMVYYRGEGVVRHQHLSGGSEIIKK